MSFSVLTLNLWNVSEPLETRYRALQAGLKRLQPDIICLQEVYIDPKSARSQAACVADMCGLAHRAENDGLAIMATSPVIRCDSVALPEFPGDGPRLVLFAELLIEGNRLLVINTHLAYPPDMVEERRRQAGTLLSALRHDRSASAETAKLLCGDFNDVADSPAIRAILGSDEGFHDAFAEQSPNSPGFTYSPKNPYVDRSWTLDQRIDFIFINDKLVIKTCSVVFDGQGGLDLVSDHFGVFSELDFRSKT